MKKIIFATAAFLFSAALFAQEALKSTEEEYYDFLSLQGIVERPTLGYRTLSDSEWKFIEETVNVLDENGNPLLDEEGNPVTTKVLPSHPWQNNNLGKKYTLWQSQNQGKNWFTRGYDHSIKCKVYGPEWFNSYNTAAPYGQNDGALWQGKGYNSSLTGGARLEMYGVELTLKPQVSFSENRSFEIMPSVYPNQYGYFWGYGLDAPQRFGNSSFWNFDWGDTEIRWTWRTFTIGAGTQSPWVGPSWLNPILHSNNAATYPKIDLGLRKTKVYLPFCNWYIGDIEGRIWTGYLSESQYFDNDSSNDHNFIHGLTFSYAPSFLPGLTLTANRACLVKAKWKNLKYVLPKAENTYIGDSTGEGEDQKMSLCANWLFTPVGLEIYVELGIDDYSSPEIYLERTLTYTLGLKKSIKINKKYNIYGEIIFEWNNTEMSQDFQWQWPYSFGMHHQITQGYTNKGQWLGSGCGYGGNSQYLAFKLYYKVGTITTFIHHTNPDMNYIYSKSINTAANWSESLYSWKPKSIWNYGISSTNFITTNLLMTTNFVYEKIYNSLYDTVNESDLRNFHMELSFKYEF